MPDDLRFATFVTEVDHLLLEQKRRNAVTEAKNQARSKKVEALKAQMGYAQTKREQQSIWAAFGEQEEHELNELIGEEIDALQNILTSSLSQKHTINFQELLEHKNSSVVDSLVGPAPDRRVLTLVQECPKSKCFKTSGSETGIFDPNGGLVNT